MSRLLLQPVAFNVEFCVMSDLSNFEIGKGQPKINENAGDQLTPGQQLELLRLRKSDLSKQVYDAMMHMTTARPTTADAEHLVSVGLAMRNFPVGYTITVRGSFHAQWIARNLAQQCGIKVYAHSGRNRSHETGDSFFV